MPISGTTALAGILGHPVAHSRSPRLHNFWLARYGIDGAYVPLPVAPENFTAAIHGLRAIGFRGANVTIPHKEAAFALCDQVDEAAQAAGAVNTLIFTPRGVEGSNTDGAGFIANLLAHGIDPTAGPALLLGAGGGARAIAASLLGLGIRVTVTNRTAERGTALAAALPGLRVLPWADRAAALADCALLVNATSLGMHGAPALHLDLAGAHASLAVADIVYVPMQTALLAQAAARGLRTAGGLGMLLHQAVPVFAQWFGVTPVVDEEVTALLAADIPVR
jgi:shikimate dehydrogenase